MRVTLVIMVHFVIMIHPVILNFAGRASFDYENRSPGDLEWYRKKMIFYDDGLTLMGQNLYDLGNKGPFDNNNGSIEGFSG